MSANRTIEDYRELARLNHSGTHSCAGACLADVVAAFDAERDALAAVAEAARNLDSKPDHAVTDARALAALRDALAAYDRTVAKP